MKLLLAPHDDDHALFTAVTCQREKPLIIVITDSWVQPNRGEFGCSAIERANETAAACKILGCDVVRLGLRDDDVTEESIVDALLPFRRHAILDDSPSVIYAPAIQGGNVHHDMVARAAGVVFAGNVRRYTTYTKTELHTTGDIEVVPTPEEFDLKAAALACYISQLRINRPHFDAVMGKSEWLMA